MFTSSEYPIRTIAIVDDDAEMRSLMVDYFSDLGFEVRSFASARAFLEEFLVDNQAFGAIVSDIRMPQMTGVDLLLRVRSVNTKIPFIIMSGNQLHPSEADAIKEHAHGYLRKPFRLDQLSQVLKNAIESVAAEDVTRIVG